MRGQQNDEHYPSWGPGVGVGDDFGSNGLPLMINVRYKFVLLGACIMWLSVWC
jgi:hypothetical protein